MEATEIRKLARLEDRHWWYRERRRLLARQLRDCGEPGRALDLGAAGGGNTRVLCAHGWDATAVDFSAEAVGLARERGLDAVRADVCELPFASGTVDLVVAFDVLEHVEQDHLAAEEIARVLRPGAPALVAVPCDMALWSAHDEAVGHVRRYDREGLHAVLEKGGLAVEEMWSWNVLLRPVAARRRRSSEGSDLTALPRPVNAALSLVVAAERYLPVRHLPGVSLVARAHRA
ncbi:class I SAM-dependent methyltransferase [Actinomadura flavalba]|uniref:class I SAM-dependent methyltransferase n=1 Tax=Actinomadura flavalba TaxID=1120938 RepID=UPI00036BF7D4|nr:class I SAM-dependent methyltransferase [Actinomadura flavalba]